MEYLKDAACISVFIFQARSVKEAQGSQYATFKLFLGDFSSLRAGFKQRSFLRLGPQPLEALRPHFSIKKTMALSWSQCHYEYRFHDARLASKVSLQEPAVWVQQYVQYKKYCFCRIFSWPRCSSHVARYGWESVCRPWFFKCSVSQVWGEIIFTTIDSNVAIWSATDLSLSLRAQTKFLVSTCHTMVTHWKDCFIWRRYIVIQNKSMVV